MGDDQLRGITREHKGAGHTLAALKPVRAARPDGYRLFVIMDNLAANKTPAIRRWARRENAGLCFTPANASRANPIQAQSGPVRTFVMGGPDHRNHPALARKPHVPRFSLSLSRGFSRWFSFVGQGIEEQVPGLVAEFLHLGEQVT